MDNKSERLDYERKHSNHAEDFGKIINKLMREKKYTKLESSEDICDFTFTAPDGNKTGICEIKFYRALSVPAQDVLGSALEQLEIQRQEKKLNYGILIVSVKLNEKIDSIVDKPDKYDTTTKKSRSYQNIDIWDLDYIQKLAEPYPDIYNEIIDLLELNPSEKILLTQKSKSEAKNIIEELSNVVKGRDGAIAFENWCIKALKYLFNDYLTGWHEQKLTIDDLQRRDLVCRIKDSKTEIWQFISHTIKSRYVVFEFKNYSKKITQREVITTERYLYPMALRNCAFIISRDNVSESAQRVIDGAMREHGKLIIPLSADEIISFLKGKDKGDDPNVLLFNKIDDFLITLGR